jgi:hypothetical protein
MIPAPEYFYAAGEMVDLYPGLSMHEKIGYFYRYPVKDN